MLYFITHTSRRGLFTKTIYYALIATTIIVVADAAKTAHWRSRSSFFSTPSAFANLPGTFAAPLPVKKLPRSLPIYFSLNDKKLLTALNLCNNGVAQNEDIGINQESIQFTTNEKYGSPSNFLSPEERTRIEELVTERSESRWNGDFDRADKLRDSVDNIRVSIPWSTIFSGQLENEFSPQESLEYKVLVTDLPRSHGGGSTWELIPIHHNNLSSSSNEGRQEDNVLQLAHAALGMAVSSSERGAHVNEEELQKLVSRADDRLRVIQQRKAMGNFFPGVAGAGELHGRKAADAALWFALAGVRSNNSDDSHNDIYDELVHIATDELLRFGNKSSCRPKDVLHIVERVAMAGIIGSASNKLYGVAADCLEAKMNVGVDLIEEHVENDDKCIDDDDDDEEAGSIIDYEIIIASLRKSSFGLHSDRPLLGLWRFSTRQRKQRAFFRNAARHFDGRFGDKGDSLESLSPLSSLEADANSNQYEWSTLFQDPSRPLVVDVGCGMGVSLLGLARMNEKDNFSIFPSSSDIMINWDECNYIGVDLSRLAIRYARGVCERWGLGHNLKFVVDPAEECLLNLSSYPGKIELAMVQFPTPFRFQNAEMDGEDSSEESSVAQRGYNAQLPSDAASGGFMVTEQLLSQIHKVISQHNGKLLIQSNCEDVAVHMKNVATKKCGFESMDVSHPVTSLCASDTAANIPKRANDYIAMGGERAIGRNWSAQPLLPPKGRTETEVACMLDNKPVHRCLLHVPREKKI